MIKSLQYDEKLKSLSKRIGIQALAYHKIKEDKRMESLNQSKSKDGL
jgi:hypothetical protein